VLQSPRKFLSGYIAKHGFQKAKVKAYQYYLKEYANPNFDDRRLDLLIRQYKDLIPGMVYTYRYNPLNKSWLDFYDKRPIMFLISSRIASTGNLIQFGVNLNFIPTEICVNLIDGVVKTYRPILEKNQEKIEKGLASKVKPLFTPNYDYMKVLDYLWKQSGATGYQFALRSYIFPRMKEIKTIPVKDWGLMTLIDTKETAKLPIEAIHQRFWEEKIKTDKVATYTNTKSHRIKKKP